MTAIRCKYGCNMLLEGFDEQAHRYKEYGTGITHTIERCREEKAKHTPEQSGQQKTISIEGSSIAKQGNGNLSIVWKADKSPQVLALWYNALSQQHKIKFSQSHAVAMGDSIEYSICVYYEGGTE